MTIRFIRIFCPQITPRDVRKRSQIGLLLILKTFLRLSLNDHYVFNEQNTKAKKLTEMKILIPADMPGAHGTIENVILTTPSCESRVPISKEDNKKYDMKEFN